MKSAFLLASLLLFPAARSGAQTIPGSRFAAGVEVPAAVDAETIEQTQAITEQLMASFDGREGAAGLVESFEKLHAEAAAEVVSARQQAARLVLGVATRRIDEPALRKQRVPAPLVLRLSVLYLRAKTAARDRPAFAAALDRISGDRPAQEAPPEQLPLVLQRFKSGVFEVHWGERPGILKVTAEPDEGIVQRRARETLLRAGIQSVEVPEVLGEWDVLSAPKLPPEIQAERKANKRILWMAKAPGIRLYEIKTLDLPAPADPQAASNLRHAFRTLHAENITHNDLDPLNVLIQPADGGARAHIIDWEFGSTRGTERQKRLDRAKLDQALSILGGGRLYSIAPILPMSALSELSDRTIGGLPLPVVAAGAFWLFATARTLLDLFTQHRLIRRTEAEDDLHEASRLLVLCVLLARYLAVCALLAWLPFPSNVLGSILAYVATGRLFKRFFPA